jgi:hypothetical protein
MLTRLKWQFLRAKAETFVSILIDTTIFNTIAPFVQCMRKPVRLKQLSIIKAVFLKNARSTTLNHLDFRVQVSFGAKCMELADLAYLNHHWRLCSAGRAGLFEPCEADLTPTKPCSRST